MSRREPDASFDAQVELTAVGDVRIVGRLGEGSRCVVYLGRWKGASVALKVYRAAAVERHARTRPDRELAETEYRRNRAFFEAPGLSAYVAEPLAYLVSGGVSALVQERLDGELFDRYRRARGGDVPASLAGHLARIVELAHAAGLYDIGLDRGSLMVVEPAPGKPLPKLFDFGARRSRIRPATRLWGPLFRIGLIDPRRRDRNLLRRL